MNPQSNPFPLTRREFLKKGAAVGGLVGVATAYALAQSTEGTAAPEANPFAYDIGRLAEIDPALLQYEQVGRIGNLRPEPRRIAIGPDRRIYVAAGKFISVLDPDGTPQNEIALPDLARCLAVSADGDLFAGLRDRVEVFDSKGQPRSSWATFAPRTWLTGISLSNQTVFLADAGNRVVWRCDRSGKLQGRFGEKNKEKNTPGFIVPSPFFDLEMHRNGLLWVANPGRHRVEAYTLEGHLELAWGKSSLSIAGFSGCCNPISLSILPDGGLVTCEKGLPRVKVYREDGTLESVVAGPDAFPENRKVCSGGPDSDCTQGGLDAAADSLGHIYILDLVRADIRIMAKKPTRALAPG